VSTRSQHDPTDPSPRAEAPSNPRDPRRATDLVLERSSSIVLVEIWNRLDDRGE